MTKLDQCPICCKPKDNWMSIDSAPKDGSKILAFEKGYGRQICWWDSGHDGGAGGFRNPNHGWNPTHWMSLPPSPESEI